MVQGRSWLRPLLQLWLPLAVALVFALFPFYWMAVTALKPNSELYNAKLMPLVVHNPSLQHFRDLLNETGFIEWTYNTMLWR